LRRLSPRLLIFLTIFIDLLGFGIVIPILSYIAEEYAVGPVRELKVGLLMASYSFFQMVFAPVWGRLSDRVGRRPILLLSLTGSVVSYALFGIARSYALLLIARSFAGVCGANLTAAQAYVADVTEPEKRASGMGLVGMAFGLGFALGPVLGAGLSLLQGAFREGLAEQTFPGLGAASLCLVNLIWAAVALPESLPPGRRGPASARGALAPLTAVRAALGHATIGPLVGVFFVATLAFSNMEVSLGIYGKIVPELKMTTREIYVLFIYIGLWLAFMNGYVVRKLLNYLPETILVIAGTALQSLALLIFPVVPSKACVYISIGILCVGQGICVPSLLGLVSRTTAATEQGRTLGVTQSASAMARILGPMLATAVWKLLGIAWPFYAGGLIMIGAVGMAILTRRRLIHQPLEAALSFPPR